VLSLDDARWVTLNGGYRVPFDPRPVFVDLNSKTCADSAWGRLWENLHHQGDVGEASYASVPHLVRIYSNTARIDWNVFAIVAIIDLARTEGDNPPVPAFLEGYFDSIQELARIGAKQILQCTDPELVRAILSVVALSRGARTHARFLINYSDEELLDIENRASQAHG